MQEQVTIMMTYYRTDDQVIHEEEKLSDGIFLKSRIFPGFLRISHILFLIFPRSTDF